MDENLPWLAQKTEDPKSNKRNLTFPPYTVNVIELNCKVIKKVATPPFLLQPPFSIFGRSYPPYPPLIRGGGVQLCYITVLYRSPSQSSSEFDNFLSGFKNMLNVISSFKPDFSISLVILILKFQIWSLQEKKNIMYQIKNLLVNFKIFL